MSFGNESSTIPESYRPLISVCFGIWGWVAVLSILRWQHIDVQSLLCTSPCKIQSLIYLAVSLSLLIFTYIYILEHTMYTQTNGLHYFGPVIFCYLLAAALTILGPCGKELSRLLKFSILHLHLTCIYMILLTSRKKIVAFTDWYSSYKKFISLIY